MKGVVLAAGKGSRLYPVTRKIAKPLLPLANRMTMEYAFDQFKQCGITDICVVVGENEPQMREALGDGQAFGVRLSFVVQEVPKGLAHAVACARPMTGEDPFMLYLGDAIYGENLKPHVEKFLSSGCANLNLVKPVEDPRRFGVANVEGDRIVKLVEKPAKPESNLAMAGMYCFTSALWAVIPDLQPSARGEYEITDAIQMMVDRGMDVRAGVYTGTWFDTGTLDSFLETSQFLTGGKPAVDQTAQVEGEIGDGAVIGAGALVKCERIEDAVILPGAIVDVSGSICHCILGGEVRRDSGLSNTVAWGDETE